jgi:hypothetical protein
MAKTTAAGAGAKTARVKASGAVKAPAKAAPVKAAAKSAKAAPARKPAAAKPTAAAKPAAAKRAATPAAKAAKAAAKAVARPAALKSASKPATRPAVKTRTARPRAAAPDTVAQARPTLVRDSFTMPEQEYAVLGAVKQACLKAGFEVKKSELLRIGVALLGQLDAASLRAVLGSLPQLKTGRPPGE